MSTEDDRACRGIERRLARFQRQIRRLSPDDQRRAWCGWRLQFLRNCIVKARILETPEARAGLLLQIDELADLLGFQLTGRRVDVADLERKPNGGA
jgi:hypothetical protein